MIDGLHEQACEVMKSNRLKQCFYLLLMWLALNLFTAFAFGFVADREIASRDFPAHDPFFVSKLIDYSDDLFLPMIRTPMIVFGSFTGIFIFVGGYLRRFVRSSFAGHVIWGGGILFTILTLGGALLLENMKADSVECNLAGGTLFGCWPRSNLQSWHLVIWICWSCCIAISGYFGRRRFFPRGLPLWLVTFAAAFTLAGCGILPGTSIVTPVRQDTSAVTIPSIQPSSPTAPASSTVKAADPSSTPIPSRQPTSTATLTPTPTETESLHDLVLPGEYVVVAVENNSNTSHFFTLYLVSPISGEKIQWMEGVNAESGVKIAVSRDGRYLALIRGNPVFHESRLYILDTSNRIEREIPQGADCTDPNWSPDGGKLVASCSASIYVISVNDGSKTLLAASDDSYYFFAWPVWSPNGKWISYINIPSGITSTFEDSLYITAAGCLEKPQTCPGEMKGPVSRPKYAFRGPMAWSPDSSFLAVFDGTHVVKNILQVVNIRGNARRTLMDDLSASGMVWLSGGQIVFDHDEHIVKVDPGQDAMTILANLDGVVIGAVLVGE